jgi:septin family protein
VRPHSFEHVGSYAFPDKKVSLNLDALPTIVAVIGPNGSGKTTIMDILCGSQWAVFPFRPGALHKNFLKKGVVDDVWSEDGVTYRSEIRVDPISTSCLRMAASRGTLQGR